MRLELLRDATEEFVGAFRMYRDVAGRGPSEARALVIARCIRSLYLAIEKTLKHVLMQQDPYLVIEKLDSRLVQHIVRDLRARPAPSLLAARIPFRTLSAHDCWSLVRDDLPDGHDPNLIESFDRAFQRLCEIRRRAQHAELYEDYDELVGIIEQVLSSIRGVFEVIAPEFLERCYRKNAQLKSRLVALEEKIDAGWRVLADYLSAGSRELTLRFPAILALDADGSQRVMFERTEDGVWAELLINLRVPGEAGTGLFAHVLTPEEERQRAEMRSATSGAEWRASTIDHVRELAAARSRGRTRSGKAVLLPLESGTLRIPDTPAWLAVKLPRTRPSLVRMRALVGGCIIEFPDGKSPAGSIRGVLVSGYRSDRPEAEFITFDGVAHLNSELGVAADPDRDYFQSGGTIRRLTISLTLRKPRKISLQAKSSK